MSKFSTDPLSESQWWLKNTGQEVKNLGYQKTGLKGIDLNVTPLWPTYTGKGIKVSVFDTGVDGTHEDLAGNFNSQLSITNFQDADGHGTSVAGIIGAQRNNLGTVGIAYEASIGAGKYEEGPEAANSFDKLPQFDVSNNSWGGSGHFQKQGPSETSGIENAVTNGRDKKGTVLVWAAGNERTDVNPNLSSTEQRGRNANSANLENSRFVIAVAALDRNGISTYYSNPGAPLLVSALGGTPDGIATIDITDSAGYNPKESNNFKGEPNYNNQFNGTSAAAPMVSGVVALMLQANPNLGYRDVQEILAYSARQNNPGNTNNDIFDPKFFEESPHYKVINQDKWAFNGATNWNGGGLHINHDYGFGLVDATGAVRLAETWNQQSTKANEQVVTVPLNLSAPIDIPDNNPTGITQTFNIPTGLRIDKIELDTDIEHGQFQDLVIKLTSPSGSESVLLDRPPYFTKGTDYGFKDTSVQYTFSSTRHWGETGIGGTDGTWKLSISDNSATNDAKNIEKNGSSANNTGKLNNATLRIYGDTITTDDTYIYTNEYATFTGDQNANRRTLTDTNGGIDTINTAAITGAVYLDLTGTNPSKLSGQRLPIKDDPASAIENGSVKLDPLPLTISKTETNGIENAYAGDGNDTLIGNNFNNILWGGRGKDTIDGGEGNDTIAGSFGATKSSDGATYYNVGGDPSVGRGDSNADSLVGGAGNDTYIVTKAAGGTRIKDSGGNNTISIITQTPNYPDYKTDINQKYTVTITDVSLSATLGAGVVGVAKNGNDLIVDLNADGEAKSREDLTIEDFFVVGTGSFDKIGNLNGADILGTPPPPPPNSSNTVTVPKTADTPLPPPTATTPGTPAGQPINFVEGSDQDDYIEGSTASDTITGETGDDELYGNEGNDSLSGGDGEDYLEGNEGNDSLSGSLGSDLLDGLAGNDFISAGEDDDFVFGGEGDDILQGEAGDDLVFGEEGKDSLAGGVGNDELYGEDGDDTLSGGTDNDTLDGGSDNDSLNGDEGADELYGDDGNDTLVANNPGAGDSLYGGLGDDSYSIGSGGHLIADDSGNDTLSLASGTLSIGFAAGTIGVRRQENNGTNLEIDFNADGNFTAADDLTVVDFFADSNLDPGDSFIETVGNLTGQQILDSFPLVATPGNDELQGGSRNDNMDGLAGDDYISGNQGDDTIVGNAGNDILLGDQPDFLTDEEGETFLGTSIGNDSLSGGEGNDTLYGGAGNDTLDGGAGIDVADYSLALDAVSVNLATGTAQDGLEGTDTLLNIEVIQGSTFADTLTGSQAAETLIGGGGADTLAGGTGNDSYILDAVVPEGEEGITGAGSVIQDEDGVDSLTLNGATLSLAAPAAGTIGMAKDGTTLIVDLNGDGNIDPATDLSILNFFNASGSLAGVGFIETVGNLQGNDILTILAAPAPTPAPTPEPTPAPTPTGTNGTNGTNGDDFLDGGEDNDFLDGGEGNDTLSGGAGNNTLSGGAGNDSIVGGPANDTLLGGTGNDSMFGLELNDLLFGNVGDDFLDGGTGNDTCFGGKDNDVITGGTGDDLLQGDFGNDSLTGNDGNDLMFGNTGEDLLDGGEGNDSIFGGKDNDILVGSGGDDILVGNLGIDSLSGGDGTDLLFGNQGIDILNGGAGDDVMFGGKDDDSLFGNIGQDFLNGDLGNDTLSGGDGQDLLVGNQGNDVLYGDAEKDVMSGGNDDDSLVGGTGNDALSGDNGNDTLIGVEAGVSPSQNEIDTLTGGAGNDLFVLGNSSKVFYDGDGFNGYAVITDFNVAEDKIQLKGSMANYFLVPSVGVGSDVPRMDIYLDKPGSEPDDLIASVQGVSNLTMDAAYFSFV